MSNINWNQRRKVFINTDSGEYYVRTEFGVMEAFDYIEGGSSVLESTVQPLVLVGTFTNVEISRGDYTRCPVYKGTLEAVVTALMEYHSYDPDFGPQINMTDEFGWSSSQDAPVIMWEEGPFEWTTEIPESVTRILDERGLFIEAVNGWCAAVYVK